MNLVDKIIAKHYDLDKDEDGNKIFQLHSVKCAMIEFAKVHCQAQLNAILEKAQVKKVPNCDDHNPYWGSCGKCGRYDNPEIYINELDKDSIRLAYDLEEKIK